MRTRRLGLVAGVATLLASIPLSALYQEWTWFRHSMLMVLLVVVAATVARTLRAPVWGQLLAMLAAAGLALTWLYPSGQELLRIIPTGGTVRHMGGLLAELPELARNEAAPVPDLAPMLLVTTAGVGLVAIVVDVLAVGVRRPALAGLPMLAMYTVPVAVSFDNLPAGPFLLGGLGYLWLLGAEKLDLIHRFGRRFTGDGRAVDTWESSPLAAAGRRMALVGLIVAVVVPSVLPDLHGGLAGRFGGGDGPGDGPGGGRVNLFAELYGQLNQAETVELIHVTSDDPDPFYLRLAVADEITDSGFAPSPVSGAPVTSGIPPRPRGAPGGIVHHRHEATITVTDDFAMYIAPTYAELVQVRGLDRTWYFDPGQEVVYSSRTPVTGLTYEIVYWRPMYDPEALRQVEPLPPTHEIRRRYGYAPEVPEVRVLLNELVDRDASQYDQVRAVLEFFSRRNGFRYDVKTGPDTDAPAIVDFLNNRVGFCVQYASAMTWLLRSLGIPARVTIGFTRGTPTSSGWVLTNRNLHAWTEVYFDGFGWVPFDPTPGTAVIGSANPIWAPDPDRPPETGTGNETDPQTPDGVGTDQPSPDGQNQIDDGFSIGNPSPPAPPEPPESARPFLLAAAALLLVLMLPALIPAVARARLRRRRLRHRPAAADPPAGDTVTGDAAAVARHRAHLAWDELMDSLVDHGVELDPTETPRATARRLIRLLGAGPSATRGIERLSLAEERARYAAVPLPPEGLAKAVRTVCRELSAESGRLTRLRAVLLPRSTLLRWRAAVNAAVTAVLDRLSATATALARLSPRRLLRLAER